MKHKADKILNNYTARLLILIGRQEDYLYRSACDYSGEKVWLMLKLAINE